MASMTIRNIDDRLKQRLRIRAATHGRSMEDEARDILKTALAQQETPAGNLAATIRARLQPRTDGRGEVSSRCFLLS